MDCMNTRTYIPGLQYSGHRIKGEAMAFFIDMAGMQKLCDYNMLLECNMSIRHKVTLFAVD